MTQNQYSDEVVRALAILRTFAGDESRNSLNSLSREAAAAVETLDNAGVFNRLDEQTDYAMPEDILAGSVHSPGCPVIKHRH